MLPSFELLRDQLLRAGIAPRHASRYVTELGEHLADLMEQQRASGLEAGQAGERAKALLGNDAELAHAMITRGPPQSLAARAPWAVFVLSPLLALVAIIAATDLSMFHLLWPLRTLSATEMPQNYRDLIGIVSFFVNYMVAALLAAGCVVVARRQRLVSGWIWIGIGLIGTFSAVFGFHMNIFPPEGGHEANMTFSAAHIVFLHGHPSVAATLAAAALQAAVLVAMAAAAARCLRHPPDAPAGN